MGACGCVHSGSAALATLMAPLLTRLAKVPGIVDEPDARKAHRDCKNYVARVKGEVAILKARVRKIAETAVEDIDKFKRDWNRFIA